MQHKVEVTLQRHEWSGAVTTYRAHAVYLSRHHFKEWELMDAEKWVHSTAIRTFGTLGAVYTIFLHLVVLAFSTGDLGWVQLADYLLVGVVLWIEGRLVWWKFILRRQAFVAQRRCEILGYYGVRCKPEKVAKEGAIDLTKQYTHILRSD